MAFGPTVILIAPNWDLDVHRRSEPRGAPVPVEPLRSWLREAGFLQHPGPGYNFTRELIDVCIHPVEGEVAFARLEFGVVNDAPARVGAWQSFVAELCAKWGFSLTEDETRDEVPVDQFRRLLAQHRIWRIVSDVNGWPPIWPPPASDGDRHPAEPILHEAGR